MELGCHRGGPVPILGRPCAGQHEPLSHLRETRTPYSPNEWPISQIGSVAQWYESLDKYPVILDKHLPHSKTTDDLGEEKGEGQI